MPLFQFNKLVRDKLPDIYAKQGQRITFRKLAGIALLREMLHKYVEEVKEIPIDGADRQKIIDEFADTKQISMDLQNLYGLTDEEIETARVRKFEKKGGFSEGLFVETIEIPEDDPWIKYYRDEPEKYKEIRKDE